jgi:hypothetical protein
MTTPFPSTRCSVFAFFRKDACNAIVFNDGVALEPGVAGAVNDAVAGNEQVAALCDRASRK